MRNLNKPPRYNVASIQAQQTLGGDVMQADDEGQYVTWRDYAWLLAEKQRLDAEASKLKEDIERLRDRYAEAMNEMCNLKAEVERLRKYVETMDRESMSDEYDLNNQSRIINGLLRDKEHLKAEVERLNTGIQPEGSNDAVGRAVNVLLEKEKEIARLKAECQARQAENSVLAVECDSLKAEVEGLRKELADAQENYHIVNEMVAKMLKEGKQS